MELLVLNGNTWKYLTVCKQMINSKQLFVLDRNRMKPFNCVQKNELRLIEKILSTKCV